MIEEVVDYLNIKLTDSGYFNQVYPLVKRIEREGLIYPAVYTDNNEFANINLDSEGSLSYWRLNSDISYSEQPSTTTIGNEYLTTIPLRLVMFVKKDESQNTVYFEDRLVTDITRRLTSNSVALKQSLKAKRVGIGATKNNIDGRVLATEEYQKVDFEPRYNYAYCSIDFDVKITTNNDCFMDLCSTGTSIHCGVVRILDGSGNLITIVDCGNDYICDSGSGGTVNVHNTDNSFSVDVTCGDDYELEDILFNINVNGVLNQSFSTPSMVDNTINITY